MELSCSSSCRSSLSLFSIQPHRSPPPRFPLCFRPPLIPPSVSRHRPQHLHLFALNQTAAAAVPGADHLFAVDDDEDEIDVDDEDDDVILPLGKMEKWLQTKPRGFGMGKAYDTAIEDKLLDEMLQSRQAQQTNLSRLKDSEKHPVLDEDVVKSKKASQVITEGVRVRMANLPKKKNIHRDLKAAFEGVPGILAISPAVSGNKKTKDPVCKGFAFVHFASSERATRFVQEFSGQSLEFGKIKKQIKCEILDSSPIDQHDQTDDEIEEMEGPESRENPQVANSLEPKVSDNTGQRLESASRPASSPLDQQQKPKLAKKKVVAKRKVPKVPKHNIPGSVTKLKFKEKAILTGVFSKYGAKTALTAMEDGATP